MACTESCCRSWGGLSLPIWIASDGKQLFFAHPAPKQFLWCSSKPFSLLRIADLMHQAGPEE